MKKWIMAWMCILVIASCKTKTKVIEQSATPPATMAQLFPTPKVPIKTIGIYLYDGYSSLDALGPYSVFTHLMDSKVFFIAKQRGIIEDGGGLKVQVDTTIDEVKHLDILLIPGGLTQTYREANDTTLLRWIRKIDSASIYTTSVCTGAWVLGAAGLLKDKKATTHWYGKKRLAEEYGAKVQNVRYTHSGKYWTGAGVSAGIDLSLALINEIAGEQYTKTAMLDLEYDPQPPFKGGSENNSDKATVEGMRALYDDGMKAVLHPEKKFTGAQFASNRDEYCHMPLSMGVEDTAHYQGKVYGFCSRSCKEAFLQEQATKNKK